MKGVVGSTTSMRWWLVALASIVLLEGPAAAAERLAVVVLPATPRESSLAENLSEVAIAHLAEVPGRQLVGGLEIRRRVPSDRQISTCLEEPACLGHVGIALNVNRAVIGVVRLQSGRCLLNVALVNIASGAVESRIFKDTSEDVAVAIAAVETAMDQLFRSKRASQSARLRVRAQKEGARVVLDDVFVGTTPLLTDAIVPGSLRVRVELDGHFAWRSTVNLAPEQELSLNLGDHDLVPRRRWAAPLAYGAAVGAVMTFASGAVLGAIGSDDLNGQSRMEVQEDLRRKERYVSAGNRLLGVGVILSAASIFTFVRYWRDIHGE